MSIAIIGPTHVILAGMFPPKYDEHVAARRRHLWLQESRAGIERAKAACLPIMERQLAEARAERMAREARFSR